MRGGKANTRLDGSDGKSPPGGFADPPPRTSWYQGTLPLLSLCKTLPPLHRRLAPSLCRVGDGLGRDTESRSQGAGSDPDQEMGVIREHGPGEHGGGVVRRQALESGEVGLAVPVIAEDDLPVEPSHRHST